MTYTQQVLNANFGTRAANTQVTLLYASEQRERTATLTAGPTVITAPAAENGVIDSPSLAIALDPDAVPSRTVVNLRWTPSVPWGRMNGPPNLPLITWNMYAAASPTIRRNMTSSRTFPSLPVTIM